MLVLVSRRKQLAESRPGFKDVEIEASSLLPAKWRRDVPTLQLRGKQSWGGVSQRLQPNFVNMQHDLNIPYVRSRVSMLPVLNPKLPGEIADPWIHSLSALFNLMMYSHGCPSSGYM